MSIDTGETGKYMVVMNHPIRGTIIVGFYDNVDEAQKQLILMAAKTIKRKDKIYLCQICYKHDVEKLEENWPMKT